MKQGLTGERLKALLLELKVANVPQRLGLIRHLQNSVEHINYFGMCEKCEE